MNVRRLFESNARLAEAKRIGPSRRRRIDRSERLFKRHGLWAPTVIRTALAAIEREKPGA